MVTYSLSPFNSFTILDKRFCCSFSTGMISTIKVVLLLSAAVIGLAQGSPAEFTLDDVVIAPRAEPDLKYRLPDDVKPLKYEVQLTPYFVAVNF